MDVDFQVKTVQEFEVFLCNKKSKISHCKKDGPSTKML